MCLAEFDKRDVPRYWTYSADHMIKDFFGCRFKYLILEVIDGVVKAVGVGLFWRLSLTGCCYSVIFPGDPEARNQEP